MVCCSREGIGLGGGRIEFKGEIGTFDFVLLGVFNSGEFTDLSSALSNSSKRDRFGISGDASTFGISDLGKA